ncbi:MAG: transglutaminase-like domain-containing protein [Vulcanimicrobiota bacterium]
MSKRIIYHFFPVTLLLLILTLQGLYAAEPEQINQNDINALAKNRTDQYYSVKANDVLIGYSAFRVERTMQLAGQSFIKFQSMSKLKVGMGSITEILFQTDFSLTRQDMLPAYLLLRQSSSAGDLLSEVIFSTGVIAQKTMIGKEQTSSVLPIDQGCHLFLSDLWGRLDTFVEHYLIYVLLARSGNTRIRVYDPILKVTGTIEIVPGKDEQIEVNGVKYSCRHYLMKDYYGNELVNIWFDPRDARIIKLSDVGGIISVDISNKKVSSLLIKSKGMDFLGLRTYLSPIFFSESQKVDGIKATATFNGRGFKDPNHTILGYQQTFTGDWTETSSKGTFEVKTSKPALDKPNPFPPKNIAEEVKSYLLPQPGIESENDYIKNKSMEITWKSKDSFAAASKVSKWIKDNIKSGIALPSALFSFQSGIGNSESRAMLMVAMCRAAGLPARKVGGMAFREGRFSPQHWAEIYLENNGWVAFDPEVGKDGNIDALRIYLWEFGDITSTEFTELDYSPKLPYTVSFYNKDLTWPVGEERIFTIKKGGNIIGEERACVEDIVMQEGKESYVFSSQSSLEIGGSVFKAKGTLYLTPQVLPLEFNYESEMGGKTEKSHFRFGKEFISQILKEAAPDSSQPEQTRNIPYSRGTYMIDQRFLSQWALVIGQIPKPQLGKKYTFTVFVPEDLTTREIELEVKNFEKVEVGEREVDTFRCESKKGMVFYVDSSSNVVKIALPSQELEIDLVKTEFKLNSDTTEKTEPTKQTEPAKQSEPEKQAEPTKQTEQK